MKWPSFKKQKAQPIRKPHTMEGQDDYTFRRSRTITGSKAEKVQVAAQNNSHLKSHRLKLHELHLKRRQLIGRLIVVILLIIGLSFLLHEYIGTTTSLSYKAPPSKSPDADAYLKSIHEYFRSNPLQQFSFSVDKGSLSAYVANNHPEVAGIDVQRTGEPGLGFIVTLRQPLLSWKTTKSQFYIDGKGISYEHNYYKAPKLSVTDASGISDSTGDTIVSSRFIRFIGVLVAALNNSKHDFGLINQVVVPKGTTHEVDVKFTGSDFNIKTNIDRDPSRQAEDIIGAIVYVKEKGINPRYIDARVEGKAYYIDK